MNLLSLSAAVIASASLVAGKVYFRENFDNDNWKSLWTIPNGDQLGRWEVSPGKFFANEKVNRGLKSMDDMKFYAIAAPFEEAFSNKEKDLVIQFSAKNEQSQNCGGSYVKVLSKSAEVENFNGQTPYKIMFGPDVCGPNRQVHVILERSGEGRMIKNKIDFKNDELTHMYTFVLSQPTQSYRVLIDGAEVAAGSIVDDIENMSEAPRMIPDPEAAKPEEWDDRKFIEDSADTKPEDYDEKNKKYIADPEATRPEDWNEAADGAWTAPQVLNPDFQEWSARIVENPDFKGEWVSPLIPNPEYKPDGNLGAYEELGFIGLDLWQVKAGTIFDNFLVTDDFSEAQEALNALFLPFVSLEAEAERVYFRSLHPENEAADANESNDDGDAEGEASNESFENTDL